MTIDCYTLEVMTRTKLTELRADAARHRMLASLRVPSPGVWAAFRSLLNRGGSPSTGRKIASPRHA